MHNSYQNLLSIQSEIKKEFDGKPDKFIIPSVIAVSKAFSLEHINPLINAGHLHFGENKIQEAEKKWINIKKKNSNIKLHFIGKLQTNKVKNALRLFDYIHSIDSYKLAEHVSKYANQLKLNPNLFIQINIGNEPQKSGIKISDVKDFVYECKNKLSLNIVGLMCLPPMNKNPEEYFFEMQNMKNKLNLNHLSMGMTNDYLLAIKFGSTFLRIGTKIFGERA